MTAIILRNICIFKPFEGHFLRSNDELLDHFLQSHLFDCRKLQTTTACSRVIAAWKLQLLMTINKQVGETGGQRLSSKCWHCVLEEANHFMLFP